MLAVLTLKGYIYKHVKNQEVALDELRFNRELLSRVDDEMSTKMTNNNCIDTALLISETEKHIKDSEKHGLS